VDVPSGAVVDDGYSSVHDGFLLRLFTRDHLSNSYDEARAPDRG
jgi:hypothetical protein